MRKEKFFLRIIVSTHVNTLTLSALENIKEAMWVVLLVFYHLLKTSMKTSLSGLPYVSHQKLTLCFSTDGQ